jgi:hypothetical protein
MITYNTYQQVLDIVKRSGVRHADKREFEIYQAPKSSLEDVMSSPVFTSDIDAKIRNLTQQVEGGNLNNLPELDSIVGMSKAHFAFDWKTPLAVLGAGALVGGLYGKMGLDSFVFGSVAGALALSPVSGLMTINSILSRYMDNKDRIIQGAQQRGRALEALRRSYNYNCDTVVFRPHAYEL